MANKKQRIQIIDAARGFAVFLMVIHHAFYDIAQFLDGPWWLYRNPVFDFLQYIFVGLFILISGVASRFSKSNLERGAIVFVVAMAITYVTTRMGMPITFGILHLLGSFMMFYGITHKLWDKLPRKVAPFIYISLLLISIFVLEHYSPRATNLVTRDVYSILGWRQQGFINYDNQTILPWIFVFLLGTWIGIYIKENKFPKWFYSFKIPFFPLIGRHALLVYILHQPILYGLIMLVLWFR